MNKERKMLAGKAADYILNKSSIANSLKALYLEADSTMLQLMRVSRRIDEVFRNIGVTTKENQELSAIKEYYVAVKHASLCFERFIGKMITNATWGSNEGENRVRSYENWQADVNSFARLTLMFIDRTYHDPEQQAQIFRMLEGMKSHGQFDERDFGYFDVKYMEDA